MWGDVGDVKWRCGSVDVCRCGRCGRRCGGWRCVAMCGDMGDVGDVGRRCAAMCQIYTVPPCDFTGESSPASTSRGGPHRSVSVANDAPLPVLGASRANARVHTRPRAQERSYPKPQSFPTSRLSHWSTKVDHFRPKVTAIAACSSAAPRGGATPAFTHTDAILEHLAARAGRRGTQGSGTGTSVQ